MTWVKRILIVLVGLAALAFLGYNLLKIQIATRAFDRAIEQNAGVDRSAALPDGLHVYMCGTGSPMPDPARAGPCIGVLAGDKVLSLMLGRVARGTSGLWGFRRHGWTGSI